MRRQFERTALAKAGDDYGQDEEQERLHGNTGLVGTLAASALNRAQPLCGRRRTLLGSRDQ